MAEAFYIRVPLDDLEQPHWRCLLAEDGGDGAIVLALRLRGLAAKCNHGGLIVRHTGDPMPLLQLATYLGYTPQHLEHRLRLLAKYGLATAADDEEGGIRVVDPVLDTHFGRLAPPVLPAEPPKRPNQRYSRPLTKAERTRLCRTGQLPDGVQKLEKSRLSSRPNVAANVTSPTQNHDITDDSECNVSASISISNSNNNSRGVTPAAVPSGAPNQHNILPPEIHTAIAALPAVHQTDSRKTCLDEPGDPSSKLKALSLFKARLADGKAKSAGYLRQAIREGWALPAAGCGQQEEELAQQEQEAWQWWQGLAQQEQARLELEHHSRLLGVRGLTDRRKALILFRSFRDQQEAA